MKSYCLVIASVLFVGCAPKPAPVASKAPAQTDSSSTVSEKGRVRDLDEAEGPAGGKQAAPAGDVPASAKSDAYEYFGLGYEKPVDLEVTKSDGSAATTGSQTVKFEGMKGGVASFVIARTGGLTEFGETDNVTSEADGVYTVSTSSGKLAGKHLELPTHLDKGKTWKSTSDLTTVDGKSNIQSTDYWRVIGIESIKTHAGPYEALHVEAEGNAVINGQKAKTQSKAWYVKGKGAVEYILTLTPEGGKPTTITIEETKPSSK